MLDFRKRLMSPTSYLNINSTADLLGKCRIIGLPAAEAIGGVAATPTAVCCRCLISRCSNVGSGTAEASAATLQCTSDVGNIVGT